MDESVILLSIAAAIIVVLPVKSSAPPRTTIIRPTVNIAPDNIFPIPNVSESERRLKAAILEPAPAKAIYAPAKIPKIISLLRGIAAFVSAPVIMASRV